MSFHREGKKSQCLGGAVCIVLILGVASPSFSQSVRPCGPPQRDDPNAAALKAQTTASKPASKLGEWELVPSLCVSERYDSNVFFSTSATHDYVTHVAPKVLVKHAGEYASGTLEATGMNETYARNPGLNFLGGGGTLSLSLDRTIKRFLPNASFGITDSVRYTPLPPSFVNPVAGTSPIDPINAQDAFARGVIAFRTNTFSNTGGANLAYMISPRVNIDFAYSSALTRYGSSDLQRSVQAQLFDITSHTGSMGGNIRISESDTLNARYSFVDTKFRSADTGVAGLSTTPRIDAAFQTHTGLLGWSRVFTPYLKSQLAGGVVLVDPGLISWSMNAELLFINPTYPVTLTYSRSAFPSILGQATPVIGNTVSLSASQRLSSDWQLAETANFSQSNGATASNDSGSNRLRFTTYRATVDLYYWMTRVWAAALSYDYMKFDSEFGSGRSFSFDRHAMTLGVKATWE